MAQTKLGENVVNTNGQLPDVNTVAPDFILTGKDLNAIRKSDFSNKTLILNIFPSIDTGVCAASVREFNKRATALSDTVVLSVSKDLPFALKRFCGAEGINNVVLSSDFRSKEFAAQYGVEMIDGALTGLLARAIVVIDKEGKVKYTELVPSIGEEPNYDAALKAL